MESESVIFKLILGVKGKPCHTVRLSPLYPEMTEGMTICENLEENRSYDKGYRVIVLGDCTATDTQEEQDYAEKFIFRKIGKVMDHNTFLNALV